jgi:hypothetical protein
MTRNLLPAAPAAQTRVLSTHPRARVFYTGSGSIEIWSDALKSDGIPLTGPIPVLLGIGVTQDVAWESAAERMGECDGV